MSLPTPQPGILDITPYKGGESGAEGVERIAKLSSNESPIGPSAKAVAAYLACAANLHRYPDGAHAELREALAKHWKLPVDQIVCGNGSDELISLLVRSYAGPGDEILFPEHGFLMYAIAAKSVGAVPVKAAETGYTTDVDALLAKVTPKTKIVLVANPNNPTGSYIPPTEMARLRAGLPEHVILAVDAAYAEYVGRNDYSDGSELVAKTANTIMLRTFSKIFGLGGMRVGWAYAPPAICDVLNRVRGPFNLNAPALAAAVAALADTAWTEEARHHNDRWLPWLTSELRALGLNVLPSVGNFCLIEFGAAPKDAAAAFELLRAKGLILRPVGAYGLASFLRLTVGTEEENHRVIAAVKEFLAKP